MDFAQGIDSDIDDVVTLASAHKVIEEEHDEDQPKSLPPLESIQVEDER
jgi:hypothetical protein